MKEFKVRIGGKERPVRCLSRDAITLKKRFGKSFRDLVMFDVAGVEDGRFFTGPMAIDVQAAFLTVCLQAGGAKVSEEKVLDWIDAEMAPPDERSIGDLLMPAVSAAFYQGLVLGKSVDVEKLVKEVVADSGDKPEDEGDDEDEEGKASPPAAVPAAE